MERKEKQFSISFLVNNNITYLLRASDERAGDEVVGEGELLKKHNMTLNQLDYTHIFLLFFITKQKVYVYGRKKSKNISHENKPFSLLHDFALSLLGKLDV
jgi:hypothetical protein